MSRFEKLTLICGLLFASTAMAADCPRDTVVIHGTVWIVDSCEHHCEVRPEWAWTEYMHHDVEPFESVYAVLYSDSSFVWWSAQTVDPPPTHDSLASAVWDIDSIFSIDTLLWPIDTLPWRYYDWKSFKWREVDDDQPDP